MPDKLPPWADRWLDGACACGSRLVEVTDMTGASQTVCKVSGWDNMMHERMCSRQSVQVIDRG